MSAVKEYASKYLLPVILIIAGLIILITSFTQGQNNYVKLGGLTLLVTGIITLLYAMSIINRKVQSGLIILLLLATVGLAFANYNTIQQQLEFRKKRKTLDKAVIERLKDIRKAQVAFKDVNKYYAGSFDQLIGFIQNDSLPVIFSEGFVPDTLTEGEALELGIIKRDTSLVAVKDTLYPRGFPYDSLRYIPNSGGKMFKIDAGEVEKNKVKVKVFEVFAPYEYIYKDLDTKNQNIDLQEGLRVGSMEEPSTSGNWE